MCRQCTPGIIIRVQQHRETSLQGPGLTLPGIPMWAEGVQARLRICIGSREPQPLSLD